MFVVACDAPTCALESAPVTSLPLASIVGNAQIAAFWGGDDAYYMLANATRETGGVDQWYRFDVEESTTGSSLEQRETLGRLMATITPIGGGRVAFPIGSSGRRVYRVWRTGATSNGSKTRILEVRAARSRRRPA